VNVENKADVAESSLQCGLKIQLMFYSHSCQIKLKKIKGKLHGIGSHQGQNQVTYCLKKEEGGGETGDIFTALVENIRFC